VRLHRLRLRRDLAQRQRGGKNLDENRTHAATQQSNCPRREAAPAGYWIYVKPNQSARHGDGRRQCGRCEEVS
jgi:hypothetical protein